MHMYPYFKATIRRRPPADTTPSSKVVRRRTVATSFLDARCAFQGRYLRRFQPGLL